MQQAVRGGAAPSGAPCAPALHRRPRFVGGGGCPPWLAEGVQRAGWKGRQMRTQAAAPGSGSNNNTSSSRQVSPSIARRQTPSATTVNGAEELLTQVAPLDAEVSQEELWAGMAWWDSLPSRYKLVLATSFSFVICNMDKVNMSVAIIPMALDFGWSPSVSGVVQAAFFYGYMLSQLPGGYLAGTMGGRRVLPAGVALFSGMTCAVPLLATTIPGLCVARAGVGLGEAVAPSAATDMIARVVPPEERSRAVSFVFGGLHVGSIAGLLAAPALIHAFGWQSVFIAFGAAGLVWVAWFEGLVASLGRSDPHLVERLQLNGTSWADTPAPAAPPAAAGASGAALVLQQQQQQGEAAGDPHAAAPLDAGMRIPYRAFLRSGPVRALCFTHFCHNWLSYTCLAWLPTFFTSTLSVDLSHAAQTALFPPLAGIAASATAGPLADGLIARGLPTPVVRKLVQGLSFLGPCAFLLAVGSDAVEGDRTLTLACITAALGMSSLSLGGMYCTHQDMSPKYASALLGLTNTVGAIPGIIGVATVGFLYDATSSWYDALFLPSATCMVAGAYTYIVHARNDPIDFDSMDDAPFAFERWLPKAPAWMPRLPGYGGGGGASGARDAQQQSKEQ